MDLETVKVTIGIGIVLILYILVLFRCVRTNRKREELYIKEMIELSIEMAKQRKLITQKDVEIEKLKGEVRK